MRWQDLGLLVVSSDEEGEMPLARGGSVGESHGDVSVDVNTIMEALVQYQEFPGYQINVWYVCIYIYVLYIYMKLMVSFVFTSYVNNMINVQI